MYQFPEGFYTDVREEAVNATVITIENGVVKENKTKKEQGVIIRLYDGKRWYISSTTELDRVQAEIDALAEMAVPCPEIGEDPLVKKYEANRENQLRYTDCDVSKIPNKDKLAMAENYCRCLTSYEEIQQWKVYYLDNHTVKHIVSSKGCDVTFDTQNCCIAVRHVLMKEDKPFYGSKDIYRMRFDELPGHEDELHDVIKEDIKYNENAVSVEPGEYTCIFAPAVTGVFAHESFGHKSESDFMVGDENMKKEWAIGSRVGADLLNIVGMTATYVEPGESTREELIAGVEKGIYIKDYKHGSGMSTFTIAPNKAYMIRDGKVAEPVKISVVTGNVMNTLHEIDGLSKEFELCSFALGGCGKMEQFPLRVGLGGPYMRVNHLNVQ